MVTKRRRAGPGNRTLSEEHWKCLMLPPAVAIWCSLEFLLPRPSGISGFLIYTSFRFCDFLYVYPPVFLLCFVSYINERRLPLLAIKGRGSGRDWRGGAGARGMERSGPRSVVCARTPWWLAGGPQGGGTCLPKPQCPHLKMKLKIYFRRFYLCFN